MHLQICTTIKKQITKINLIMKKNMKKTTFLTICLSLFLAGGLFAQTTWYVTAGSNGGSNTTGDGSVALPFATPFAAHGAAAAGDIIIIDGEVIQPGTINVTKNLTFTGINNAAIIDNAGALQNRVFNIFANDISLTFNDLGFKNLEKKDASGVTVTGEIGVVLNTNAKTGVNLAFNNCIFVGNKSTTAGALFINGGAVATLTNCLFKENQAEKQGGAIHIIESSVTMTGCTFYKNKTTSTTANLNAGVMFVNGATSAVSIDYCTFYQNTTGAANQDYGAIRTDNGNTTVTNSLFYDNKTNNDIGPASDWGAGPSGTQSFTYSIGEWISGNVDNRTNFISFVKGRTDGVAAVLTNSNLTLNNTLNKVTFKAPNAIADNTPIDFDAAKSDIGAWDSKINIFKATTNNVWNDATNWSNGTLPEATDNVAVVTGAELTLNINTSINDIKVAGTLKINSGLALIVNGVSNVTGLVRYFRSLTNNADLAKAWHLVSSPLSGEVFDVAYADKNDIAVGTGSNRGIASYNPGNTGAAAWTYFTGTDITTIPGQGYSMKITPEAVTAGEFANNLVAFEGDFNTADVSKSLTAGFNLLGNPYTSYVNSKTFLDAASTNIDQTQMWVWNSSTENYDAKTAAVAFVLAPAQGFFVKASVTGTETFAKSNQATEGGTFQKSTTTEVNLWMTDGSAKRYAKLYYLDTATNGFDFGYEGEVFGGVASTLSVFTDLVANSQGKKYQVQSLPNTDYETTVVAVGVKAEAGKEITFTAEALNLPDGLKVFLEDRLTNTFTRLDEANATYKVTVSEAIDGTGRFYLHTKASGVLSIDEVVLDNISIYTPNNTTLRVTGLSQGKATVKLFNILGKQVMQTSFTSTGVRDIVLSKLAAGMYIVQLETEAGKLNKKIVLE
jgi:predicted outer membrane repeat protein